MKLTARTKVGKLVEAYPFLIEFLGRWEPKFQMLKNPIARKTVARFASLGRAASLVSRDVGELIHAIAAEIKRETGQQVQVDTEAIAEPDVDPEKVEVLRNIIRKLHEGADVETVKAEFTAAVDDVSPAEIAAMEESLVAEGLPEEEVKRLCDVHVEVFKQALDLGERVEAPEGHPIHTFQKENAALAGVVAELRGLLGGADRPPANLKEQCAEIKETLGRLSEVEKHYQRKENQLFPFMERYGVTAPPKVMWGVHDDIRALFKQVRAAADACNPSELASAGHRLCNSIEDMIYKEENILFPMSFELLSPQDWGEVRKGEAAIGYALVEPGEGWPPPSAATSEEPTDRPKGALERLPLDTGLLSLEQVNLMLTHLPVDLSLVDEEDVVRYYSDGRERIFPRSPGVIGRRVQNCHPTKSVHMVDAILDAFKKGEREVAEFWIEMQGKFLHIRYFALRDGSGKYKGCLESSQDVTGIRALQGERRLLEWE